MTYRPEGKGVMSPTYAQQHKPVVEQSRAVGHAVRAGYLYAGMADVSALTGEISYARAAGCIWRHVVDTKMHITGGLGATRGIEGFGPEYVLPNKEAYNETCAAVANVFFNVRMFLLHQDAKYFDVAEVALLNNALAGVSLGGDRFFYVNPLEADGKTKFNHRSAGRAPWFGCACCPSNIARLVPQVPGYMYAHTDDAVYVTLYGSSRTTIPLAGGKVQIVQTSRYPFDGRVDLTISPALPMPNIKIRFDGKLDLSIPPAKPQRFALKLRIPTWARTQFVPGALYSYTAAPREKWTVTVNGTPADAPLVKGFAVLDREWRPGDEVRLDLPMPVRFSTCIDKVAANRGRLAVTRGPLVYCAEEIDNGGPVQRFYLPEPPKPAGIRTTAIAAGPLKGVIQVSFPAMQDVPGGKPQNARLTLVPYYAWNNRGEQSMIVWLPRRPVE